MNEMVLGDENLRFTDAEIVGEGLPARRRVRRRRPVAPQDDPEDLLATLQATILIGLLIVGPLAIGLAEYAKRPAHQQAAEHVHHEERSAASTMFPGAPNLQERRDTEPRSPMFDPRTTSDDPGVRVWSLRALDGRTYRIESRPGKLPAMTPPGFRVGYSKREAPIYDAPDGNIVARLTKTTLVLYAIVVSQEPCWHWIVTADGAQSGFACIVLPDRKPRSAAKVQPPEDHEVDRTYVADLHWGASPPRSRGFLPRALACADAPGRFRMVTSGPVEHQGLYELPLCDQPGVAKRAYTIHEVTQMPRLLHKVAPEYTEAARIARYQGTVFMHVLIDEEGTPAAFRIIRSLGLGLDENAVKAVRRWSCQPAYRGETPVPMWVPVEVNFRVL